MSGCCDFSSSILSYLLAIFKKILCDRIKSIFLFIVRWWFLFEVWYSHFICNYICPGAWFLFEWKIIFVIRRPHQSLLLSACCRLLGVSLKHLDGRNAAVVSGTWQNLKNDNEWEVCCSTHILKCFFIPFFAVIVEYKNFIFKTR